jgi:hydroxymethylpyrimidine pyrophosphatase-like HAD family hydrolase
VRTLHNELTTTDHSDTATDLDGTFLGGPAAARRRLYSILREAPDAVVVFVTGRGLDSVRPLLEDAEIPDPQFIIADVGATIVHGKTLDPVAEVQDPIERRWPGAERVRQRVSAFPGLVYQDVPQERRCSFFAENGHIPDDLVEVVAADLGCDVLLSAGIYLDVLPSGVSKGTSLLALLEHEGLDRERVVVAGDTLNDLSLFGCGLKGVVVGGAEDALCQRVREIGGRCYIAEAEGGGGIIEGLEHHGMISASSEPGAGGAMPAVDARQLVMVYHRLPFEEVRRRGRVERRRPRSPNGIIPTLLGFFRDGREGLWIGWSKQETRSPAGWVDTAAPVDPEMYPNLKALRIPLTAEDVNLFYEVFSKEAFWPVIFSFPERVDFDADHWRHYLGINRLFAERTAGAAEPGLPLRFVTPG